MGNTPGSGPTDQTSTKKNEPSVFDRIASGLGFLSAEETAARKKRAVKREKAVAELLSTETTYVEMLHLCIKHYMIPLDPKNARAKRSKPPKSKSPDNKTSRSGSIFRRNSHQSKPPDTSINNNYNTSNTNTATSSALASPTSAAAALALEPSATSLASETDPTPPPVGASNNNNYVPRKDTLSVFDSLWGFFTDDENDETNTSNASNRSKSPSDASRKQSNQFSPSLPSLTESDQKNQNNEEKSDLQDSPMLNFPNAHKILSVQDHDAIFSDLGVIHGLNANFLASLQAVTTPSQPVSKNIFSTSKSAPAGRISDPFETFTPLFAMYQNYMNLYNNKIDCLAKNLSHRRSKFIKSRNRDVNIFAEYDVMARKYCKNQNLQALIILPIQRLPRYKLLLSEILKNTEKDDKEYKALESALQGISEMTSTLNSRIKEYEAREMVSELERRFGVQGGKETGDGQEKWSLIKPDRLFVKEGKLSKIDRTGKAVEKVFLLFTDVLIYATQSGKDGLQLNQEIPINAVFGVKDILQQPKGGNGKEIQFEDRGFEIHSSVKSFIVFAKNLDEKNSWLQELNKIKTKRRQSVSAAAAAEKDEEKGVMLKAAPLLIPDNYSDVCMAAGCSTKFSTFNRKHHCRECGYIICSKCGNNQIKLSVAGQTSPRVIKPVCNDCYVVWQVTQSMEPSK